MIRYGRAHRHPYLPRDPASMCACVCVYAARSENPGVRAGFQIKTDESRDTAMSSERVKMLDVARREAISPNTDLIAERREVCSERGQFSQQIVALAM